MIRHQTRDFIALKTEGATGAVDFPPGAFRNHPQNLAKGCTPQVGCWRGMTRPSA